MTIIHCCRVVRIISNSVREHTDTHTIVSRVVASGRMFAERTAACGRVD